MDVRTRRLKSAARGEAPTAGKDGEPGGRKCQPRRGRGYGAATPTPRRSPFNLPPALGERRAAGPRKSFGPAAAPFPLARIYGDGGGGPGPLRGLAPNAPAMA